jgi:hypothetical protein
MTTKNALDHYTNGLVRCACAIDDLREYITSEQVIALSQIAAQLDSLRSSLEDAQLEDTRHYPAN